VTLLTTFETGARFAAILGGPPTAVREFDPNLVAHEEPFVILGDAFLSSFLALELYETITKPDDEQMSDNFHLGWADVLEFDVEYCTDFTEATL
jgi:hypothetical protein